MLVVVSIIFVGCAGGGDPSGDDDDGGQEVYDLATDVVLETSSYGTIYDGQPKKVAIYVYTAIAHNRLAIIPDTGVHEDFVVTYQNNINPGTATAIVSAKESSEKFKGSKSVDFTIQKGSMVINDFAELKANAISSGYGELILETDITIQAGSVLTIDEGVTVILNGYTIENNGTIINNGIIWYSESGFETSLIKNNGTFTNNGTVELKFYKDYFFNLGSLENNGILKGHSKGGISIVSNTTITGTNPYSSSTSTISIRKNLADCDIVLAFEETVFTGKEITPTVTSISKDGQACENYNYEIRYENNINAGTATAILYASDTSHHYYGTKSINFKINKKSNLNVKTADDFFTAIRTTNYSQITVTDVHYTDDLAKGYDSNFTVPEDVTLVIDNIWVYFTKKITVNGKLLIKKYSYLGSYADEFNRRIPMRLTVNGEVEIANGVEVLINTIEGGGKITNFGGIMLGNEFADDCLKDATIDNYGEIYEGSKYASPTLQIGEGFKIDNKVDGTAIGGTYLNKNTVDSASDNLTVLGENYVVRPEATSEMLAVQSGDSKVSFDGYTTPYNATVQKCSIFARLINNTYIALTEQDETCTLSYVHTNNKDGNSPINSGDVDFTVKFGYLSNYFYGEASATYSISPITAIISQSLTLDTALNSENYNNYEVSIETEGSGEIKQGETLTITPSGIVKSSMLSGSGSIVNNGILVNNSKDKTIVDGDEIDAMLYEFTGTVTSSGTIYLNGYNSSECTISGTGNVIERTHISNIAEMSSVEGSTHTFDAVFDENDKLITKVEPEVAFLGVTKNTDYTVSYANSNLATPENWDRQSYVFVKSVLLSEAVYGDRKVYYTINQGTAYVASIEQLKSVFLIGSYNANMSNNFATYGGEKYSCFKTVYLAGDIELRMPRPESSSYFTFTILRGTTFALGNTYKLTLASFWGSIDNDIMFGYRIINNGTITAEDGSQSNLSRHMYYNGSILNKVSTCGGSGSIIGYASTAESVQNFATWCDKIILEVDLDASNKVSEVKSSDGHVCSIDLNGHSVAYIGVDLIYAFKIMSSTGQSTIDTIKIKGVTTDESCNAILYLQNVTVDTLDRSTVNLWWANNIDATNEYIDFDNSTIRDIE